MKPHLPTKLLQSLLASFIMSPMLSLGAENIIAEGVNANDVSTSERFYDTGKGYYFNFMGPGYRYLWEDLMDTFDYHKNWNFLGDLSQRIPSATGTAEDFKNLTGDGNTCWAQTSINIVEYWNSYYGVFNTDSRGLVFGRSYSANYLEQTGGTLSLKQNLLFLDTFPDIGGNIQMYLRWYFEGYDNNSLVNGQGGYWKDYFKTPYSSYQYELISTKEKLTNNILPMLGYTKTTNGSYELSTKGQIVYVGLDATDGLGGHAITCYGVQLNDAGQIKSLYVTNSDDILYDLFTVYVDDDLVLYEDANHTKLWDYAETSWYIDSIGAIQTPTALKNKLTQYEDVNNPLVWNGEADKWDLEQKPNYSELPSSETGWNVLVDQKNYPIYYNENRAVVFDDSAKNGSVTVDGKGWANSIELKNKSLDYVFTGTTTSTSLSTNSFNASNGSAQFNNIKLYSTQATLNDYSLTIGNGSVWSGESGCFNYSSVNLNGGKVDFDQLSFSVGSLLEISAPSSMSADTLNISDNVSFVFNSASTKSSSLNLSGDLVLSGDSIDIVLNAEIFSDYGKYALISFSDGLSDWKSYFSTLQGNLSYSNNTLYITYDPTPSQEWTPGDGIWSAEMFGGVEDGSNGSKVFFGGDKDYTVSIDGAVAPAEISVNSSSDIVLTGNNAANITGDGNLIKTNSGTLTIETSNSFTGGTLIEDGVVKITNQDALGSGEIALAGGKLSVDLSDISSDAEFDNNISGDGTIDLSVSSTLKITGSNTFEGVVNLINGGTIEVESATSLGSASIYLNSGTLDMNGKAMENEIHVNGTVSIDSGRNFLGKLVLENGTINGSTRLKIQEYAELHNGSINADLSGNGSLYVRGNVSLTGDNSVANTIIESGRLTANTIKGDIVLNGGTLAMDNGLNLNSGKSLSFNGGVLETDLTLETGRTLNINTSSVINGDLELNGGIIKFNDACLSSSDELLNINGCLNLSALSYLNLNTKLSKGVYSLFAFDSMIGELDNLALRTNYMYDSRFYVEDNQLMFEVINCGQNLSWTKKNAVWQEGVFGVWEDVNGQTSNVAFTAGDVVIFGNNTGTVTLKGTLDPGGIEVNSAKTITFKSDKKTAGQLSGSGDLYKYGSGKLSLNNGNSDWMGDIYLYGGSIVAGGSTSFGSGDIAIYNGTLDLAKKQISNDITIDGYGVIKNGKYFSGDLVLVSGSLGKNTSLNIGAENQAILKQGELVSASLYGAGMVIVDGNVCFNSGTSVKTNSLLVTDSGVLNIDSKGLTMDKKVSVLDIQSGQVLSDGNLSTYAVSLTTGGELTTRGTKAKSLTTTYLDIFDESTVTTTGNVSTSYLQMNSSELFVTGITGSQKLSVKYDAGLNDSFVDVSGSMSARSLWLDSSTILLADPYKSKAMGLSVKNGLSLSDASLLNCSGKISVGELYMDKAMIELVNPKATQSLTVKGDANLYSSDLILNGSVSTKNLYMDYTSITLDDINPEKTQKALGLTAKGDVSLFNSSVIDITGSLSAYNLSMTDSRIDIHGETSSQKLSTKYDTSLLNSSINVNGSMSVGRGLSLDNSTISLIDPYKNKAMGLSVKKSLSLTNGSRINCTGKISAGELYMDSTMIELSNSKSTQSLTVKGASNLYNSSLILNGSMSTKSLYMDYTTITLDDVNPEKTQKALGLTAKGDVSLFNLSTIDITGSLSAYNLSMTDSRIDIHGETSSQKLSTKYDASLKNSSIDVNGSMSVGRGLSLDNSMISLTDPYKNKPMGLSVKNDLCLVNEASICSSGKISASNLSLDGSWLEIYGANSAQSLSTKYDMNFYGSSVYVAGSLSARNFSMTNSMLSLSDPFKNKPMNVSLKGDFSMSSGSILELSGKLSAKNIIFDGGSLNLTSDKLQTITAKSNLCFNDAIDLNWNFDFQPTKSYKIFSFKTFTSYTDDLYSMLGLSSDCCILTLNEKKKYITLEVTDSDLWDTYMTTTTTWGGLQSSLPQENEEEEDGIVKSSEEKAVQSSEAGRDSLIFTVDGIFNTLAVPFVGASQSDTVFKKLSDTLIQTTWGTVSASQSFASMLENRGQYAMTLAKGKGFAWINTYGSSTRLAADGDFAGSDSFLAGAAAGAELNVSKNSGVGVAFGHSRGKVSTFSAYSMDEDATHFAVYGQHLYNRHQFSWSAIYGTVGFDGTLAGVDCDWTQDVIQLDLRWDAKMQINRESYSYLFAGLQYLATNSGDITPDIDSGSVQYLRSKLGAGYMHSINADTHLFGELSFVSDLARNNPTATINLWRSHGSNPGRLGGNLNVGIRHQLNKDWSLNASYQLNFMKNLSSHNASIGATCEF